MKYLVNIYAIHSDGFEGKVAELTTDYTFLDTCEDAETEIDWQISENKNDSYIEAYRYVVYDLNGECYTKVISVNGNDEEWD